MNGVPWKQCATCGQFYLYAGNCFSCGLSASRARHFKRVLDGDVWKWTALGWIDSGEREHIPSVHQPLALLEWHGDKPLIPENE